MTSFEYSFTVTLKPILFKGPASEQYDDTYVHVWNLLNSLASRDEDNVGPKLTLVSELTKNYNIHYHGIIQMPLRKNSDCMKRFHDVFRNNRKLGFVNIKQIEDKPGWITYITKDLAQTRDQVNRPPIIYDYYNIVPNNVLDNLHQIDVGGYFQ